MMPNDSPFPIPQWVVRLAGGTILFGMFTAFVMFAFMVLWMAWLTWQLAGFSADSKADRTKIHEQIVEVQATINRIEHGTKAVESAVVPRP